MWTAATPAARSPSCPRWCAAIRSTPEHPHPRHPGHSPSGDVAAAEKMGGVIKLIAWMKRGDDGSAWLRAWNPALCPKANQLAGVDDVFNAVWSRAICWATWCSTARGAGQAAHRQRRGGRRGGCPQKRLQGPRQPVLAARRAGGRGCSPTRPPAAYYVRVAGIAPAVVEAIYGYRQGVVDERFDGCAYFVERPTKRPGRGSPQGGGRGRQREAGAQASARGSIKEKGQDAAMKIKGFCSGHQRQRRLRLRRAGSGGHAVQTR